MLHVLAALFVAAWPPVQGVVDVRAQEPNSGFGGCVLVTGGAVRCWPSSTDPRFVAENWPRLTPVAMPGLDAVRKLSGACAITEKGQVFCLHSWRGRVDVGIVGATDAIGSSEEGCALLSDGRVSCWGPALDCSPGRRPDAPDCEMQQHRAPAPVKGLPPVRQLAGGRARCGLTEDGDLWCWGRRPPLAAAAKDRADFLRSVAPARVADLPKLERFWADTDLALAVTREKKLLAWRRPSYDQAQEPVAIRGAERLVDVRQVAFGRSFVVFVLGDGSAWLWGRDPATPVSDSFPPQPTDPVRPVPGIDDAVAVSAATEHACLATRSGLARCFGRNSEGQLGDGTLTVRTGATPSEVVEIRAETLPDPESKACLATRELRLGCQEAGWNCSLFPPPGPVECRGGARRPEFPERPPPSPLPEPTAAPVAPDRPAPQVPKAPCLCSCSREFRDAQREAQRQRDHCSQIP